jgi:hypothetical protein
MGPDAGLDAGIRFDKSFAQSDVRSGEIETERQVKWKERGNDRHKYTILKVEYFPMSERRSK